MIHCELCLFPRRFGSNTFSGSNFMYSSQFLYYYDPDQRCDKSGWGGEREKGEEGQEGEEGEGLISINFVS